MIYFDNKYNDKDIASTITIIINILNIQNDYNINQRPYTEHYKHH